MNRGNIKDSHSISWGLLKENIGEVSLRLGESFYNNKEKKQTNKRKWKNCKI